MRTLIGIVLSLCTGWIAAGASPPEPLPRAVWPLDPRPSVVRGFDPPDSPWGSGHRGVDLLGRVGEPVLAAAAGRITFAGSLAGLGVVVVDHGALRTTYEPVSAAVRVGATVAAGQRIGTLELGGSHCLPRACLHWGLLRGSTYLDPLILLGAAPVRLLPLTGLPDVGLPAATGSADSTAGGWWPAVPAYVPFRRVGAPGGMPVAVVP